MMKTGWRKLQRIRESIDLDRYSEWHGELINIFERETGNFENIKQYDEEIVRDYYANGYTAESTYKELLSELTINK